MVVIYPQSHSIDILDPHTARIGKEVLADFLALVAVHMNRPNLSPPIFDPLVWRWREDGCFRSPIGAEEVEMRLLTDAMAVAFGYGLDRTTQNTPAHFNNRRIAIGADLLQLNFPRRTAAPTPYFYPINRRPRWWYSNTPFKFPHWKAQKKMRPGAHRTLPRAARALTVCTRLLLSSPSHQTLALRPCLETNARYVIYHINTNRLLLLTLLKLTTPRDDYAPFRAGLVESVGVLKAYVCTDTPFHLLSYVRRTVQV